MTAHLARFAGPLGPLLLLGALLTACSTSRTLTIDSEPSGARVWVNGEEKGVTPVMIPFVHYGWFDVRLEKKGYEARAEEVHIRTPIDGYPIIDLPFELAVRRRHFHWTGTLRPVPSEADVALKALLDDAQAFRRRTLREARVDEPRAPARRPAGPVRR